MSTQSMTARHKVKLLGYNKITNGKLYLNGKSQSESKI